MLTYKRKERLHKLHTHTHTHTHTHRTPAGADTKHASTSASGGQTTDGMGSGKLFHPSRCMGGVVAQCITALMLMAVLVTKILICGSHPGVCICSHITKIISLSILPVGHMGGRWTDWRGEWVSECVCAWVSEWVCEFERVGWWAEYVY